MQVESRSLGPTSGPVIPNHWESELLTKHYFDQGSLGNTPVVPKLTQEIEIWIPLFPAKKTQNKCIALLSQAQWY